MQCASYLAIHIRRIFRFSSFKPSLSLPSVAVTVTLRFGEAVFTVHIRNPQGKSAATVTIFCQAQ
jgi:hypothetical protein